MRTPTRKTLVLPVCENLWLPTDSTTGLSYVDVDVPGLAELGPRIERLRVLTVTTLRMPAHAWGVFVTYSITGRGFSTPVALHTEITANGETVESAFTSLIDVAGRRLKVVAGSRNTSGTARNTALVTAWLAIDLKT